MWQPSRIADEQIQSARQKRPRRANTGHSSARVRLQVSTALPYEVRRHSRNGTVVRTSPSVPSRHLEPSSSSNTSTRASWADMWLIPTRRQVAVAPQWRVQWLLTCLHGDTALALSASAQGVPAPAALLVLKTLTEATAPCMLTSFAPSRGHGPFNRVPVPRSPAPVVWLACLAVVVGLRPNRGLTVGFLGKPSTTKGASFTSNGCPMRPLRLCCAALAPALRFLATPKHGSISGPPHCCCT
jgi:hypothetical protein